MTKSVDIYLVSSSLHFFWALLLAHTHKGRESHLVFIDQYANNPLNFYTSIRETSAPFTSVDILTGRELSGLKKLKNRQSQFARVRSMIANTAIDRVFLGSDRSVIGQYFIKEAKAKNAACLGCYLDDGVFSYLGRDASKQRSERYIDAFFKKLSYGFWYDPPSTVGASRWIDALWVMYPEQVCKLLQPKKKVTIPLEQNALMAIGGFAKRVLKKENLSVSQIEKLDVLITLPNHHIFSKIPDYELAIDQLLSFLSQKKLAVGVKYHPAAGKNDFLKVQAQGAILLPSQVSFEMILPFLRHCTIIGDMSTTILLANFIAADQKVVMMKLSDDAYSQRMIQLCERLKIEVVKPAEMNEKFI